MKFDSGVVAFVWLPCQLLRCRSFHRYTHHRTIVHLLCYIFFYVLRNGCQHAIAYCEIHGNLVVLTEQIQMHLCCPLRKRKTWESGLLFLTGGGFTSVFIPWQLGCCLSLSCFLYCKHYDCYSYESVFRPPRSYFLLIWIVWLIC